MLLKAQGGVKTSRKKRFILDVISIGKKTFKKYGNVNSFSKFY